jgi:hypothetical protein
MEDLLCLRCETDEHLLGERTDDVIHIGRATRREKVTIASHRTVTLR